MQLQPHLYTISAGFGLNAWANFNLSTGAVGTVGSAATASIISIGNGWYRCSVTAVAVGASDNPGPVNLVTSASAARNESWTAIGTETIHAGGAQIELGTTATPYVATTSSTFTNVVIPRSVASPTQDVAGNTLGVTGPVAKLATAEVRCVTGDGSAVYVDLGSALIPATADFSLSLWYYHTTNDGVARTLISQAASAAAGRFSIFANDTIASNLSCFIAGSPNTYFDVVSALTANTWHYVTLPVVMRKSEMRPLA